MKIVSVMTGAAPGGAEFAAGELLDALVARGHEAVVLSDWPGIDRDTAVRVAPIQLGPKLSARSWPGLAVRWPLLRRRLRAALEAEAPYDVLLLHYKKDQLLAAGLPAALRKAVVWAEWGPLPRQMRSGPGRRSYLRAARGVRHVLAISDGTRDSLLEAGLAQELVSVVPNALRTDGIRFNEEGRRRVRGDLGVPESAFVVGCTSRFHPRKRNDVLIDAVIALAGDAELIMAGTGPEEAALRERAAPLGARAHFLPTPGDDRDTLFSAFDVCVFCPSPSEGSPTSVILGMLTERPCVSTAAEGVAGLIDRETGAIVEPENDPAALAALLGDYAADPGLRGRQGAAGRRLAVERFDRARVAERVEEILEAARAGDGG
jgi:glycosyltransferase involved in cell wall biosynthesis